MCSTESQKYCTVHCTGYMRSWPTHHLGLEGEGDADKESSHFSCLVAMGRVHYHTEPQANGEVQVKPTEFITRFAMDGKFTFVDQRYRRCGDLYTVDMCLCGIFRELRCERLLTHNVLCNIFCERIATLSRWGGLGTPSTLEAVLSGH